MIAHSTIRTTVLSLQEAYLDPFRGDHLERETFAKLPASEALAQQSEKPSTV